MNPLKNPTWFSPGKGSETSEIRGPLFFKAACLLVSLATAGSVWAQPLNHWHVRHSGSGSLLGITFAEGLFVTVGTPGQILTSRTGQTWATQNSGTSATLRGVTYGNGRFLAVGDSGTILASPDGTNWTAKASGVSSPISQICYGNGVFIGMIGSLTVLTSTNGDDWVSRSIGAMYDSSGHVFANGLFLLESRAGTNLVSADGLSWIQRPSGSDITLYTLGSGKGVFMSIDIHQRVFTSTDASNWVQTGSVTIVRPSAISYGNGHFVTAGAGIAYTPDSTNWFVGDTGNYTWYDLAFGLNTFVAVGFNEMILQSDPVLASLASAAPGVLEISAPLGKVYTIEASNDLARHVWNPLGNLLVDRFPQTWIDPDPPNRPSRLYRTAMQP